MLVASELQAHKAVFPDVKSVKISVKSYFADFVYIQTALKLTQSDSTKNFIADVFHFLVIPPVRAAAPTARHGSGRMYHMKGFDIWQGQSHLNNLSLRFFCLSEGADTELDFIWSTHAIIEHLLVI